MEPDTKDYLNDDERRRLEENITRREIMLNQIFKGGEVDSKEYRVANEILTSADTAILRMVELRQKAEQHKDDIDVANNAIAMTRLAIKHKRDKYVKTNTDVVVDLPDEFIPSDIVPGEDDMYPVPIDADDFIQGT